MVLNSFHYSHLIMQTIKQSMYINVNICLYFLETKFTTFAYYIMHNIVFIVSYTSLLHQESCTYKLELCP